MKKAGLLLLFAIAAAIFFCSCENVSSAPKGVIERDSGDWYVINTSTSSFNLTGTTGQVHLSYFDATGGGLTTAQGGPTMAYFRKVVNGGWLVYASGKSGCMYIPYDISEQAVGTACMTFAMNNDENIMTYEEAKKYISFLN